MLSIRPVSPDDMPDLFRVRTSVRENHQSEEELLKLGITCDSLSELLRSGEAQGWCAEVDGTIVGFSMARKSDRDIFALFVVPEFERGGIGTSLLKAAVDWLRIGNPKPIHLSTGRATTAFSFYRKRGWREIDSIGDDDAVLEFTG
ncbi:MAG TPA: GNAT family N-acetyltransferase [Myxococcota bacterium]